MKAYFMARRRYTHCFFVYDSLCQRVCQEVDDDGNKDSLVN